MSAQMVLKLVLVCSALTFTQATKSSMSMTSHGNPIRKVVNMLSDMQAKVTAEGKKEEKLFEKFMCYCKNNVGGLKDGVQAAKDKIEELTLAMEADAEKKKTTGANLKEHKASLSEAKTAMDKATALREKEAADFAKYKEGANTNIGGLGKAISAIKAGAGSSFLQTNAASVVKKFTMEKAEMADEQRREVLIFLSGQQSVGDAAPSDEILGIMGQMLSTMQSDLAEAEKTEEASIASFDELIKAKQNEVDNLQPQVEKEMKVMGEFEVKYAEMDADLENTKKGLVADTKFLVELEKGCSTKEGEWEVRCKLRQEELLALSDTIKILNDDDALELFKKTLPGAGASFLQIQVTAGSMKKRALAVLKASRRNHSKHLPARPELDFIMLALNGKQQGFEKVIKMIDTMVKNLETEQTDDDEKKEYCEKTIDELEDSSKVLKESIKDGGLAIEEAEGTLEELKDDIAKLTAGIVKLDKSVKEATAQRKQESADFDGLMSGNTAAKEILLFAKNRLNKFYNPKLYKPPAFVQGAPPPPPETFGAYSKKSEDSGGVIGMIDSLVADLEKEMTEAKVEEKNAQEEYETLMSDAGEKRGEDSEAINEKDAATAENEKIVENNKLAVKDLQTELMGVMKELYGVHGECDFLLKFYDVRKDSRVSEIDAMGKAKAVLNGADFSLLQTASVRRTRFLA